jgi:hypothetical protein
MTNSDSFSFSTRGSNGVLSYRTSAGFYSAAVRIKTLSYNYGVTSDESHARDERAFYPHRRIQGEFSVTIDCLGYKEYRQLMVWLKVYANLLLDPSSPSTTLMDVQLPARNFHKIGALTTGIDDHDQVGSMVFSPELVFVSISDPNDSAISLVKTSQVSQFKAPQIDANASLAFYPVSVASYKDTLLYDDLSATSTQAAIDRILNPKITGTDTRVGF